MKTNATFCFKFKLTENKTIKKNCRIVVELTDKGKNSFQVITYMYKGKDIIKVDHSCVACYTYCKDIFFNTIERKNINIMIMNNY